MARGPEEAKNEEFHCSVAVQNSVGTKTRSERLELLQAEPLDVLILGGGIVGAGTLWAAAQQGLRAALVEQSDFAFGTSSRSTRLLHGGLRYLAQGRFGLVFEANQEKIRLSRVMPHLVKPLPFNFPSYRTSPWPLWQLWCGVKLYDALCFGRNFQPSRAVSNEELRQIAPGLKDEGLRGGVRYFDALTNDARLVIDTLRGASIHGAIAVNYVLCKNVCRERNQWICTLVDVIAGQEFTVKAAWVVNATGPWANSFPQCRIPLRLTKGIHIVIRRERLPVSEAVVLCEKRRILFVIPWGERVVLGTTDTDYNGPLEEVWANGDDIAYVLDVVNDYFPEARLKESDLCATWAGLRPLVARGRGGPSDISRAHVIRLSQPGWVDVAGGKLTTYLLMGEHIVAKILRASGRRRRPWDRFKAILADERPLVGIFPPEPSPTIVRRMGTEEWACHLDDVMIRRTSWHYFREDVPSLAGQVSMWMAQALGWSEAQRLRELEAYRRICQLTHVPWGEESSRLFTTNQKFGG